MTHQYRDLNNPKAILTEMALDFLMEGWQVFGAVVTMVVASVLLDMTITLPDIPTGLLVATGMMAGISGIATATYMCYGTMNIPKGVVRGHLMAGGYIKTLMTYYRQVFYLGAAATICGALGLWLDGEGLGQVAWSAIQTGLNVGLALLLIRNLLLYSKVVRLFRES